MMAAPGVSGAAGRPRGTGLLRHFALMGARRLSPSSRRKRFYEMRSRYSAMMTGVGQAVAFLALASRIQQQQLVGLAARSLQREEAERVANYFAAPEREE